MPLGREADVGPCEIVLDGDPAPPGKGHSTPTFRPVSTVAKRSPISATGELLLCLYYALSYLVITFKTALLLPLSSKNKTLHS